MIVNTNPPIVLCPATNLVPNPSFESYTNCPDSISELNYAAPWYHPTDGTSDYYNTCATDPNISVSASFTGFQFPFTGQGYAGAFVYNPGGNNATNSYREYLQTPLSAPLAAGQSYTVSFYVSRADNYVYSIADLGAYFSVGPVGNLIGFPSCTFTPDNARKGWDGCIYGNHPPRGSTGNKTARLIITPLTSALSPPITALDLVTSNLTQIAFDNPSLTTMRRKKYDGHVSLLKAYDDGANEDLEFFAFADNSGQRLNSATPRVSNST